MKIVIFLFLGSPNAFSNNLLEKKKYVRVFSTNSGSIVLFTKYKTLWVSQYHTPPRKENPSSPLFQKLSISPQTQPAWPLCAWFPLDLAAGASSCPCAVSACFKLLTHPGPGEGSPRSPQIAAQQLSQVPADCTLTLDMSAGPGP